MFHNIADRGGLPLAQGVCALRLRCQGRLGHSSAHRSTVQLSEQIREGAEVIFLLQLATIP